MGNIYDFYNGYAVVEGLPLPGKTKWSYTYLIDKQGNKVGDFTEITGRYGEDGIIYVDSEYTDSRVLPIDSDKKAFKDTIYYANSHLQKRRVENDFPVQIYDPIQKKTFEVDENLKVISEKDGKVVNSWGDLILTDYNYPGDETDTVLTDKNGNVLCKNVYYAYEVNDGVILTEGDTYGLYTTDDTVLVDDCVSIYRWENGYIIEIIEGQFIVVDKTMETLWQTDADCLRQPVSFSQFDSDSGKYVPVFDFLMHKYVKTATGVYYQYVSPQTGNVIVDYNINKSAISVSKDFYALNDTDYGQGDPQQFVELVDIKTGAVYVMDGVYTMQYYSEGLVMYYTSVDNTVERKISKLVSSGGVPLLEGANINDTSANVSIEPFALAENDVSSI